MSKPRYLWHGYVKNILYKYPNVSNRERNAVDKVISDFKAEERQDLLDMIKLYYFSKSRDMRGAANELFVSEATAIRKNREIMHRLAFYMGLMD